MASFRAPQSLRNICTGCARYRSKRRLYSTSPSLHSPEESSLPRVATTSFWSSLIPKPFRRPSDPVAAAERAQAKANRPKTWNPAVTFMILGVLVGSNAINLIALRNEMLNFSRKTDAKLSLLREVIQRVKDGEDVDVKKELGTGDPQAEAEWEEVVKELENTDMLWEGKQKRAAKRAEKAEQRRLKDEEKMKGKEREGSPQAQSSDAADSSNTRRPKFLM